MIRNLDTISEQIVFEGSDRQSYPELIFNRFDKHNNCNPLVENIYIDHSWINEDDPHPYRGGIADINGYTEQIFKPYSIEVVD